jgi:hypothetical protein
MTRRHATASTTSAATATVARGKNQPEHARLFSSNWWPWAARPGPLPADAVPVGHDGRPIERVAGRGVTFGVGAARAPAPSATERPGEQPSVPGAGSRSWFPLCALLAPDLATTRGAAQ